MTLSTRGLWPFLRGEAGYERDVALSTWEGGSICDGNVCPFYDGGRGVLRGEDDPIYK